MKKKLLNEIRRMQQLAGILSESKTQGGGFQMEEEGAWRTVTNADGEITGKDYEYDSSDPEYHERRDNEETGKKGAFTSQKSDAINYLRDLLKSNDIYSKILMGRNGRYIYIPYGQSNGLSVEMSFRAGRIKLQIGTKAFDTIHQAFDYITGPNFNKEGFVSQSEHEGSLKSASKERRQQAKANKAAEAERAAKRAKTDRIMALPAIKDAVSKFGLYNKSNYKVVFGNIPARKFSDTIEGIIDAMTFDELKQVKKIDIEVPKFY